MIGLLWLAGCWPDIRGRDYEPWTEDPEQPKVTHEDRGDGVTRTVVDAVDPAIWVSVDLDRGAEEVEEDDSGWDLRFSRQRIALNGGVSGTGGVALAAVEAESLDQVTEAPADGYASDLPDDEDENEDPEYAFDAWFDYDESSHVLTPRDYVFVVRTTDDARIAVEVISYYDDAGSSGLMQLDWKEL